MGGGGELIGRAGECGRLDAMVAAVRAGEGGALVLRGMPGVGKTALLEYCGARAGGVRVLRARGVPFEAELPFSTLYELVRPVLGHVSDLPEQQADTLRAVFAIGGTGPTNRLAAYVATLSLLAAAAERVPVLCLVDDAQWIDHASAEALLFTARRLLADRVGIVFASRDAPRFEAPGVPELALSGLPSDAAIRLAMRSGLHRRVAAELADATEGNPLALIELPATLSEDHRQGRVPLDHPLPVVDRIETAFLAQARGLPADSWRALVVVAISEVGGIALLERALKVEGLDLDALDPAVEAGLIAVPGQIGARGQEVVFRHPLVRAALRTAAGPGQRRSAHLALAAVLTGAEDLDRRAWHLAAAAADPDEDVAALLAGAAERAQRRGGVVAEARAYERSARLTPDPDVRASRLMGAVRAWANAGTGVHAAALAEEVLTLTRRSDLRCAAKGLHAHLAMQHGHPAVDESYLAEAEAYARTDPANAGRMMSAAVNLCWTRLDVAGMLSVCTRVAQLTADAPGPAWPKGPIRLAAAQVLAGVPGGAELAHRWVARCSERADGSAAELAEVLCWIEDHATARSLLEPEIAQARATNDVFLLAYALTRLAGLEYRTGRMRAAHAAATEAVLIADQVGLPAQRASALAMLALVEALVGGQAAAHVEAARRLMPDGFRDVEAHIRYASGMSAVVAARWTDAVADLEWIRAAMLEGGVREPGWLPVTGTLAEAYAHLSQPDRARELLAELDLGRVSARAAAGRVRGLLAAEPDLDDAFGAALTTSDATVVPLERARTLLCYGQRLRRAKRRRDAREQLRAALALFDAAGAQGWARRCRAEIEATGRQGPAREDPTAAQLTTQERQIAFHAAEGLTNRQIAARLFLSPKTVEYHLGNVYRKLNLRSRVDLIRHLSAPS